MLIPIQTLVWVQEQGLQVFLWSFECSISSLQLEMFQQYLEPFFERKWDLSGRFNQVKPHHQVSHCICGSLLSLDMDNFIQQQNSKEFLPLEKPPQKKVLLSVKGFFCWSCCLTNELVAWEKEKYGSDTHYSFQITNGNWAKKCELGHVVPFEALQCERMEIYRCSFMTIVTSKRPDKK